ncbi:MAG: FumA C-terminus/TtdB family hydratase beta subunit [Candidatus Thermoplasmatota archaeon]|nr:FumA C-terminus/TtdB family hydratase beta subunit [Candidatus Thermoplasmatota archaeon]
MERMITTPLSEEAVRSLRAGDRVYLTGTLATLRDAAHRKALALHRAGQPLPLDLSRVAVYHCGPLVRGDGEWRVVAAGPTTSSRMEDATPELISALGVRMIVGKGGMGAATAAACQRHGCLYAVYTGGAAVLAARAVRRVAHVYWREELGEPEALWVLEVERFGPLTVDIDAVGGNLTADVQRAAVDRAAGWNPE